VTDISKPYMPFAQGIQFPQKDAPPSLLLMQKEVAGSLNILLVIRSQVGLEVSYD